MNAQFIPVARRTGKTIAALYFAVVSLAMAGFSLRADLVVHLSFDDEAEPWLDSSGNDLDGEIDGALWVDDSEREGALEFTGGDDGFVRIRPIEALPGDGFTIMFWAYRDPLTSTSNNGGLFQVQLGGDTPSTAGGDKVIGAWVAGDAGVWGRLHQEDGTQLNLDRATFVMENETWTHFAYRGDGTLFEVVIDGEAGIGPALAYDGTLLAHDTIFVGKQGGESWGGRLDDFRVYNRALSDEEIETAMEGGEVVPPPCPDEGDTHCLGLTFDGPDGNVTGNYVLEADAADDSDDTIRYTFVAESDAGEVKEVGPQTTNTASIRLTEGTWTLSVTVDDSASCDDVAADASCSVDVEVKAREPSPDDLQLHLAFDDEADPGLDSSGNDYVGEVDGAVWVADPERDGVLEFTGGNDGFVRVGPLEEELPGDDFTLTFWAYRDPVLSTSNNGGLFQVQFGGDTPTTDPAGKVIGAWVAGSAGVWGRLHQADGTRLNLDQNTFLMEDETWTHFAYRGDGEIFEILVNGESGIGPFIAYDGTLGFHDTVFIGKQGGESWGGRLDDFRVYSRALSDEEIEAIMEEGEVEPPACPEEGDTHCVGLTFEGPDDNLTGAYVLTADAADDTDDTIRYTFVAESDAGEVTEVGPQIANTATIRLTEGTWTLSVTVDDSGSCDDEAADATCTVEVEVKARGPSEGDLLVHLTFDEEEEPGLDSSGNDLDGEIEGAVWVDDGELDGALEFTGGNDGFVRIRLFEELPSDDFTFTFWAFRDPFTLTGGNDGLFQVQLGGDVPTTDPAGKAIGAWVAGGGGVWGRLHQADATRLNLDQTFFMLDEAWTHFAYRGDGETFEVVVDGEPGLGPSLQYDGTLAAHDTIFIGKQGGESWGGRLDDFRVYTRALSDEEIELVMEGEDLDGGPKEPTFLRGDTDANGSVQLTDAIIVLDYLFAGTVRPTCLDALDWNDSGGVEIADAIGLLERQFSGGDPAPAPGSEVCGIDPTEDDLSCESFAACQ